MVHKVIIAYSTCIFIFFVYNAEKRMCLVGKQKKKKHVHWSDFKLLNRYNIGDDDKYSVQLPGIPILITVLNKNYFSKNMI